MVISLRKVQSTGCTFVRVGENLSPIYCDPRISGAGRRLDTLKSWRRRSILSSSTQYTVIVGARPM